MEANHVLASDSSNAPGIKRIAIVVAVDEIVFEIWEVTSRIGASHCLLQPSVALFQTSSFSVSWESVKSTTSVR